MTVVVKIIQFLLSLSILVLIHELGHFLAAKMTGMRVDVFAIGFGKRLFGYNKKTGFTFGNLPKDFDGEGEDKKKGKKKSKSPQNDLEQILMRTLQHKVRTGK